MGADQHGDLQPNLDQLVQQLLTGRISRRNFIVRLGAAGLSMGAIGSILDACGGSSTSTGGKGGSIAVSITESPSSLDPAFGINAAEFILTSWLYDNLVWLGPDLKLKPMLATSWTSSSDGLSWTFNLRKDAKFTTGRAVVADDVVFSISRIIDPATASPGRSALGPLQKVEAVDSATVRFTLSSPYTGFPTALSDRWGRIVPRDKGDQLKTQAFGSGPFTMKQYVPGSSATLVRNPAHWEPGVPALDQVTLRIFPDPVGEIAALSSGDTQIMYSVAPSNYAQVAAISGVKAYEVPTGSWLPMVMRVDTTPFNQLAVRQAIKYCIDRPSFVQILLQGHGTPANDHNIPPSSPFYLNVPLRQQDYGKAKQLLAQAGLPNGFSHDLYAATDTPLRANTAVTIQQMVAPAGITFNVKTVDYNTYIAQIYKKAPLYIGNWAMRPVLDAQLSPFFSTNGSFNEYHYSNPQLDALLAQARSAPTAEAQMPLYHQVQQILTADGPALIPYLQNFIEAASTRIKGFQPHPMSWLDVRYLSYS